MKKQRSLDSSRFSKNKKEWRWKDKLLNKEKLQIEKSRKDKLNLPKQMQSHKGREKKPKRLQLKLKKKLKRQRLLRENWLMLLLKGRMKKESVSLRRLLLERDKRLMKQLQELSKRESNKKKLRLRG